MKKIILSVPRFYDFNDFRIDKRLISELEVFIEDCFLPILKKIHSDDWTYMYTFHLANMKESDHMQKDDYPLVPNSPTTYSAEKIKAINILILGNEIVLSPRPMSTLGKAMTEGIVKYYSRIRKRPSQLEMEAIFEKFDWERIDSLQYPPETSNEFEDPYGINDNHPFF